MDYKGLNDFELIYQVRENDEVAYGALIDKYSHLVTMLAKKYLKKNNNIGLEFDDLYQEGMMGVIKALDDYNANDTIFYTYASLCAKREMDKIIKIHKRKKMSPLNNSISLNYCIEGKTNCSIEDLIPSKFDLEQEFEYEETFNKLMNAKYSLDLTDSSIFELKMNGFSTREIANLLELTYKSVDYRMRKIRKKLINCTT